MTTDFEIHEQLESISRKKGRGWDFNQSTLIFDDAGLSMREQLALQTGLLFIRIGQRLVKSTAPHSRLIRKTA